MTVVRAARRRDTGRSALALISVSEERRFLRIAIVNDDMPFLVDSIAATIVAQGIAIDRLEIGRATRELQSLMRISKAALCRQKRRKNTHNQTAHHTSYNYTHHFTR